jgi:hypothetical protein
VINPRQLYFQKVFGFRFSFYFSKLKTSGVSPRIKFSSALGGGGSREPEKEDTQGGSLSMKEA